MSSQAKNVKVGQRLLDIAGAPMVREIVPGKVDTVVGFRVTGGDVIWRFKSARMRVKVATSAERFYESL